MENIQNLLEGMIVGDEKSLKQLYDYYGGQLFHLAYSILHSRESAEEVVLDVFLTLWNKRDSLSHVEDIRNYLYVSVKNRALHYLRRGGIEKESVDLYEIELMPDEDNPENELIIQEYAMLIQEAIHSLPPKCREVFRLVYADKLKNREIAELLNISEKTVNIHISLAYKRIGLYVNKQYGDSKRLPHWFIILLLLS